MGRLLEVDLHSRTARTRALDERLAALFVGGRGLGTALLVERLLRLHDRYPNPFRAVDPLSPENPLVISTSPPNGTMVPTGARFHANFKSPLTGGIGSTNGGGRWGVEFKRTGHDAMVVTGRSLEPVVLFVDAGGVRFDAPPEALRPTNVAGSAYKAHVKLRLGKLTRPPEQFGILSSMGTAGLLGMLSQYDELIHCNFRDTRHVAEQIERIGGEALAVLAERYGMEALARPESVAIDYADRHDHPVVKPIDAEPVYLNPRVGLCRWDAPVAAVLDMLRRHKGACFIAGVGAVGAGKVTLEQAAHHVSSGESIAQFRQAVHLAHALRGGPPLSRFEPATQ